jgi:hypothetical protein
MLVSYIFFFELRFLRRSRSARLLALERSIVSLSNSHSSIIVLGQAQAAAVAHNDRFTAVASQR